MTYKKVPKLTPKFCCELCDFTTSRKSHLDRHYATDKHKNPENTYTFGTSVPYECSCGKVYKHRQSLHNHKKKCNYSENENLKSHISEDLIVQLVKENQDIKNILTDQNKTIIEQQKTINELVPKVGNNNIINSNNTNNIVVMLNEKCKDALNLNEFIESLTITLEDLNITKDRGIVEGITNAFVKNLKQLEIHKRPLHCTDIKREVLYIKDNEFWEKDVENEKIKKTINKVAHQQRQSIDMWLEANPMNQGKTEEEYIKLVKNSTQSLEDTKDDNKIVKNICKEISLNKQDI